MLNRDIQALTDAARALEQDAATIAHAAADLMIEKGITFAKACKVLAKPKRAGLTPQEKAKRAAERLQAKAAKLLEDAGLQ